MESTGQNLSWYQGLTRYHWWVLIVAISAWMFDCMDQRLFILSRAPAIKELSGWPEREKQILPNIEKEAAKAVQDKIDVGELTADKRDEEIGSHIRQAKTAVYDKEFKSEVDSLGDGVTALMMLGWAVGGLFFGIYGDRLGRVKTLSITIAIYSVFTGLSGTAFTMTEFFTYRFLVGCGIGGAFATSATLIAETMPARSRATALGVFQALSALGNITGSLIGWFISADTNTNLLGLLGGDGVPGWRVLMLIGVLPALLVAVVMRTIKEPDAWLEARELAANDADRQMGDLKSLFTNSRWRRNMLVGLSLAIIGVIGLWGVGFYSPELIGEALGDLPLAEQSHHKALGTLFQDIGAALGMLAFTFIATRLGRKAAFGGCMIFCWVVVSGVFMFLRTDWQIYVMLPILGFATLSLFGGYSIYFPELFPTRLRATGVGFCYNVGRVGAAAVILFKIPIREAFTNAGFTEVFRSVSVALASVYIIGLLVLIWAPETKGKPLPTDDDLEE